MGFVQSLILIFAASTTMLNLAHSAANDGYRVCRASNPGCAGAGTIVARNSGSEISEWCTCRTITNSGGSDVLVPTRTENEYRQFLLNPPSGVSFGSCSTNGGFGDYRVTSSQLAVSVRGCNRVTATLEGGGGGAGVRQGTSSNSGAGGVGGELSITNGTMTTTSTSTVDITVGAGGESGACRSGALGGTGEYAGGRGSIRAARAAGNYGLPGAGVSALGGAAGSENGSDNNAGVANFGGGGGGGDANTGTRNGGGGGAATVVLLDGVDFLIAGGGGGGGGTRANAAGQNGGTGGTACTNASTGAGGAGGSDSGNANAGAGGGGGACYSAITGATFAATGGTGVAANTSTCVSGGSGTVNITFFRSPTFP